MGRNRFLFVCIVVLVFIVVLVSFPSDSKQEETIKETGIETPATVVPATTTTTTTTTTVPVTTTTTTIVSEPPKHVVASGETLTKISLMMLEDPARWLEISVFNELENPHVINPGQVIDIPLEEVDTSGVEVPLMPGEAPVESPVPTDAPKSSGGSKAASTPAPASSSGRCGGDLPSCAVMECESGGSLTAHNPTSSASGKWQIIDSTWKGTDAGANSGVSSAADAPEHVQDAAAREIYAGGSGRSQWTC